jgi:hypothetical protein
MPGTGITVSNLEDHLLPPSSRRLSCPPSEEEDEESSGRQISDEGGLEASTSALTATTLAPASLSSSSVWRRYL